MKSSKIYAVCYKTENGGKFLGSPAFVELSEKEGLDWDKIWKGHSENFLEGFIEFEYGFPAKTETIPLTVFNYAAINPYFDEEDNTAIITIAQGLELENETAIKTVGESK